MDFRRCLDDDAIAGRASWQFVSVVDSDYRVGSSSDTIIDRGNQILVQYGEQSYEVVISDRSVRCYSRVHSLDGSSWCCRFDVGRVLRRPPWFSSSMLEG